MCFVDFNKILNLNEKLGGKGITLIMVAAFRKAINDCNLVDLRCRVYPFIWSNRKFEPHFVEERHIDYLGVMIKRMTLMS